MYDLSSFDSNNPPEPGIWERGMTEADQVLYWFEKGITELCRRIIMPRRIDRMRHPIRRLEPVRTRQDIQLPVLVDIGNRRALANKIRANNMFDELLCSSPDAGDRQEED